MKFEELVGKVFTKVYQVGDEELVFETTEEKFTLLHWQDCCESVYIESVVGDLDDLVGSPVLFADESTKEDNGAEYGVWTFYKLATVKGWVDIRFYGSSNGYYGVGVSLDRKVF